MEPTPGSPSEDASPPPGCFRLLGGATVWVLIGVAAASAGGADDASTNCWMFSRTCGGQSTTHLSTKDTCSPSHSIVAARKPCRSSNMRRKLWTLLLS